jgi:hypothetical protein
MPAAPKLYLLWLTDAASFRGKANRQPGETGSRGIAQGEGQLNYQDTSNEKTTEQAGAKKPYKTPSVRFESVFEVSALSCGKISSTQSSCKVSMKAS